MEGLGKEEGNEGLGGVPVRVFVVIDTAETLPFIPSFRQWLHVMSRSTGRWAKRIRVWP